jgi:hypothetical protein
VSSWRTAKACIDAKFHTWERRRTETHSVLDDSGEDSNILTMNVSSVSIYRDVDVLDMYRQYSILRKASKSSDATPSKKSC